MSEQTILVEVLGSHDRVQSRTQFVLGEAKRSIVVGRSALADVVLDDDYVAARHLEIHLSPEGALRVSDLDTINGIKIAGQRQRGVHDLALATGELQLGRTRLRIRTAAESLPPEKPEDEPRGFALRHPAAGSTIGALLCVASLAHTSWVGAPRDVGSAVVSALMPVLMVLGIWISIWALLARVTLGEWRWLRHAAVILMVAGAYYTLDGLFDIAGFALSLPPWGIQGTVLGGVMTAFALFGHLINASRVSRRRALVIAALLPALAGTATVWVRGRDQLLNVNNIAVRGIVYPPAIRLRAAASLDEFFADAASLKDAAEAKRRAMPRGLQGGEDDWDDE